MRNKLTKLILLALIIAIGIAGRLPGLNNHIDWQIISNGGTSGSSSAFLLNRTVSQTAVKEVVQQNTFLSVDSGRSSPHPRHGYAATPTMITSPTSVMQFTLSTMFSGDAMLPAIQMKMAYPIVKLYTTNNK